MTIDEVNFYIYFIVNKEGERKIVSRPSSTDYIERRIQLPGKKATRLFIRQLVCFQKSLTNIEAKEDDFLKMRKLLQTPVKDLDVSIRLFNYLKAEGIVSLAGVAQLTEDYYIKSAQRKRIIQNKPRLFWKEICEILAEMKLIPGMDIAPYFV